MQIELRCQLQEHTLRNSRRKVGFEKLENWDLNFTLQPLTFLSWSLQNNFVPFLQPSQQFCFDAVRNSEFDGKLAAPGGHRSVLGSRPPSGLPEVYGLLRQTAKKDVKKNARERWFKRSARSSARR